MIARRVSHGEPNNRLLHFTGAAKRTGVPPPEERPPRVTTRLPSSERSPFLGTPPPPTHGTTRCVRLRKEFPRDVQSAWRRILRKDSNICVGGGREKAICPLSSIRCDALGLLRVGRLPWLTKWRRSMSHGTRRTTQGHATCHATHLWSPPRLALPWQSLALIPSVRM